jgi:NAD(P)H-dependent FMN reductase
MVDSVEGKLFLPLLLGTNRMGRESEDVAKWVYNKMMERSDIETRFFDVASFRLPLDDYGTALAEEFSDWREAILDADGLVIVTPEYNHGYPGVLKSVLDLLLKEYIHKAVGFVGVSAGPWGGSRVIEAMVPLVRELGLSPTFTDLNFPNVNKKFDENGDLIDPAFNGRADAFLDELVWLASTLRWGRANLPSVHHPR